jgi:hypothetical protein
MAITYTSAEITDEDTTVKVTYTNENGFIHERSINIPRLEDGSVNEEYYQEILEGQLRGVENKVAVNAITFIDPNAVTDVDETPGEAAPVE